MFAAFKVVGSFLLACASIVAAIWESGHPLLFACAGVAFVIGLLGAELFRAYRNRTVRSATR